MSDHLGYPGAPPGWYPDPAGGPGQRWWDGYAWTETVVVPQQPPPPPWSGAPPPAASVQPTPWAAASQRLDTYNASGLVSRELAMAPTARIMLTVPAVTGLLTLLVLRTQSSQLLQLGQEFKMAYDAASRGLPAPTLTNQSFSPWFLILGLVSLGSWVVILMWQHRAASAARALGFPNTHSPAWGVGSWFVPILNFWFPYQAIRDCLPPEDPNRAHVLQWWLAFQVAGVLGVAAFLSAYFSSGVAFALSIPAAVLYVAVLATAPRVVAGIASTHRETFGRQSGGAGALGGS